MFLLVLAHPGSPGKRAIKRLRVCVRDIKLTAVYNTYLSRGHVFFIEFLDSNLTYSKHHNMSVTVTDGPETG